jgi:general secretion pathway protein G
MSAQNKFSKKPPLTGIAVKTAATLSLIVLILLFGQKLLPVSDQARIKMTRTGIMQLEQALGIFHLDNGFYPTTEQGLSALVSKPSLPPAPPKYEDQGYIKKVPSDGWNREYIYLSPGKQRDFEIISLGADGEIGGEGINADINNWE